MRDQEEARRDPEGNTLPAREKEVKKRDDRQKIIEEIERREQEERQEADLRASNARVLINIQLRARREEENKRRVEEQQRQAREISFKFNERQRLFLAEKEEKERIQREILMRLEVLALENERLRRENSMFLQISSRPDS
jgi:hypothetical protein